MIGFNNFGNYGHLGNQMFQYASLKGIASNNGHDWCIPDQQYFGNHYDLLSHIYQCFNIKCNTGFVDGPTIEEKFYPFDEDLFNNCPDNINLNGYFQTEKYFINIKDDIKKDFSFSQNVTEDCKKFIQDISPNGDVISLHVRRGDYVNLQSFHPLPSIEYYMESLSRFDPKIPVLIFSNDSDWCKSCEIFSSDRFLISESNDISYDLCMMTMCSHHIMANSSFSWWGAWLSESKHVIAPKKWFGPSLTHNETFDLYCSNWEIL